jgi:hypothetical protein
MTDEAHPLAKALETVAAGTLHVGFVWMESGKATVTSIDIAGDDLSDFFHEIASAAIDDASEKTAYPFGHGEHVPPDRYGILERPQKPEDSLTPGLDEAISKLRGLAGLNHQKDKPRTLPTFYATTFVLHGEMVICGRLFTRANLPKTKFPVFWGRGRLTGLHDFEDDALLLFDRAVDWFCWRERYYILNGPGFERAFLDIKVLQQRVQANINAITKVVKIVNVNDFMERCSKMPGMMIKLDRIVTRGQYVNFTVAMLKKYTTDFAPTIRWSGDEVEFDGTMPGQWQILKMLDEAWFTAPLSQEKFEATQRISI